MLTRYWSQRAKIDRLAAMLVKPFLDGIIRDRCSLKAACLAQHSDNGVEVEQVIFISPAREEFNHAVRGPKEMADVFLTASLMIEAESYRAGQKCVCCADPPVNIPNGFCSSLRDFIRATNGDNCCAQRNTLGKAAENLWKALLLRGTLNPQDFLGAEHV